MKSTHAEIDLLFKLQHYYTHHDSKKISIFVGKINVHSMYDKSRPCLHCLRDLRFYNIKYIYYTMPDGIYRENYKNMIDSHLTQVSTGIRLKNGLKRKT